MDKITWLSVLPPRLTIAIAIWSKKIIPSLLIGLLAGSYFLHTTVTGGFETAVDQTVKTLTEPNRAMLVSLFISIIISGIFYFYQKYDLKKMTADIISGGNEIMTTLAILAIAGP